MSGRKTDPKKEKPKPGVGMSTRADDVKKTGSPRSCDPVKTPVKTTASPKGESESRGIQEILRKLDTKLDNLDDRIEFSTNELKDKIDDSNSKVDRIADEAAKVKDVTTGLRVQVNVQGTRLSTLEAKIEQLEREKRKNTLVIEGVEEIDDEDVAATVENVFKEVGVTFTTQVCINIYRRGKKPTLTAEANKPAADGKQRLRLRPIVVVFLRQTEKSEFFRNIRNLKGNDEWRNVFFNDDLTELQANEQRDLRALAAYARNEGKEAVVRGGALWFENRKYRYNELHKLPPGFSLLKAKTLEILDGKAVVFQSPHSPLSNLYPCNVVFRGEPFVSAEGAFHYARALISGHEKEANEIKGIRCAYKVKDAAKSIGTTQEWENMAEEVMKEILLDKFKRNRFCREFLLSTGKKRLFEGTGDRRWACGIPISRASSITLNIPGRNILGKILEEIREELRNR